MSKYKKLLFILGAMAIFCLGTVVGSTSTYSQKITAWFYPIKASVDGVPMNFSSPPFIYNGHTYVPIKDVAKHLGFDIDWNNESKRLNLISSVGTNNVNTNTASSDAKHQLDFQNYNAANRDYELSKLNVRLSILDDSPGSVDGSQDIITINNEHLKKLRDIFNDRYDSHRNNGRTLRFKDYKLSQLKDDTVRVNIYGDFRRAAIEWRDAKTSDFQDFIEDICEEINKKFSDDIEIIVYDEDDSRIAEYSYEKRQDRLRKEYFYSISGGKDKDKGPDLDEMGYILDDELDSHESANNSLHFESYELTALPGGAIRVKAFGKFKRDDSSWEDLNKSEFEDFLREICAKINEEYEKDIELIIYDLNKNAVAEYGYEFKKDRLYQLYFYSR